MTQINPKFLEQVAQVRKALDTLDYFQILRVTAEATTSELREAYHKQARMYHPDKYSNLGHDQLNQDMTTISKRITEAYVVLRDDKKRARYKDLVAGPKRLENLRYNEQHQEEQRQEAEVARGKTPAVKSLYAAATKAWREGRADEAIKNIKMAIVYEGDNQHFKELLSQWQPPKATAP